MVRQALHDQQALIVPVQLAWTYLLSTRFSSRSALQGLLRKLGAGFEDMIPGAGMSGSRIKVCSSSQGTPQPRVRRQDGAHLLLFDAQGIINNLKQAGDESSQLTALTDLCELLSISTEDTMTVFPVEQVVPLLVSIENTSKLQSNQSDETCTAAGSGSNGDLLFTELLPWCTPCCTNEAAC
jgi:hypothetical protein